MMNHASISSDGQLLMAVGDEPKAFFCRRVASTASTADEEDFAWQQVAEVILSPAVPNDACFTTAFSPSGHVCAVAQQSGVITVFDTSKIHEDMEHNEAVIEVFRSSRASSVRDHVGAVRSMSFSPAPWDLLAWAEDRGRVCVTDLRSLCRTRQTVDLDLDSPNINRASVTDLTEEHSLTTEQRQLEIERRFLQRHQEALNAQNDLANVSHVADYIEVSAARRRLPRISTPAGEFNDLTESERQMLEFIRTHRPQENDAPVLEHESQRPVSVSYLHGSSDPSGARSQVQEPAGSSNSPSLNAQQGRPESMRDTMRRSYLDRSRTADRSSYQPRRRGSVVISSSNNSPHESSSSHPSSLAPMGASVPTLSASPSRLASVVANAENVDWQSPGYGFSGTQQAVHDITDTVHSIRASWDSEQDQTYRQGRDERERDQTTNAGAMIRLLQQQQQQLQQSMQQEQQRVTQQLQQERQELSQMMARVERQRTNQVQRSRHVQTLNRAMAGERGYENSDLDMLRRLTETSARREYGVRTMGIGWNSDGRSL
ncbi:MAG: hypothetical protein Q9212_000536 [Teloschistes hypoglaucus]